MVFVSAILFFLMTAGPGFGADVAKIGIIDFQRFLTTSKAGKNAQNKLKAQGGKMEAELKKKESEIKELQDRFEREAMVMSKEMREQKEREYRIKIYDLKSLEKNYREELKTLENKLVSKIRDDLLALIEEVGKKEGYLIIIDKAVAYYHPSQIDITDQLIKTYNERGAGVAKEN